MDEAGFPGEDRRSDGAAHARWLRAKGPPPWAIVFRNKRQEPGTVAQRKRARMTRHPQNATS
jgi:hypothetical protein